MGVNFEVKLLGQVNKPMANDVISQVCPKFVIVVTAAQLAQWLRYKKVGKKNPYQIDAMSLLKIDNTAQRGVTDNGFALQDESKVSEIKEVLLGTSTEATRLYLGTLVWNIRPNPGNLLKVAAELDPENPHLPSLLKLKITTDAIWLTDSAHRHFGIVEAVATWQKDKEKFPKFSDNLEFSIDLYNLDAVQENALFRELNAKQKKISASKAQQTDTGSALGLLKSTILARDQSELKLFDQNIEVNANENTRHTLMTMSVFTSSVQNMYGKLFIEEARSNDVLRDEMAEYYCNFFYALRSTIRVKVELRGEVKEVAPFQNLYEEIIAPAIDNTADEDDEVKIDQALTAARERASELNQTLQRQEKIHSNAVVKALSRIAGRIRYMKNWERVVSVLQTDLIAAHDGRYFQKSNEELLLPGEGGVPIATRKIADDSINIQVQDQVIREIQRHLTKKLSLDFPCDVRFRNAGKVVDCPAEKIGITPILNRTTATYFDLEIDFSVGAELELPEDALRLRIQSVLPNGVQWKNADKVGTKKLTPVEIKLIEGYDHPVYPGGFKRYSARFEIAVPPYADLNPATIEMQLDLEVIDIDGQGLKLRRVLPLQPAV
ncbi:hypothetical protein ABIE30_000962 [Janthinobacterium lividum]|uniref:hypothetical protein n=1 Tax=Janthinobacterium lividum TaxID=29581 RepID=UPI003D19B670